MVGAGFKGPGPHPQGCTQYDGPDVAPCREPCIPLQFLDKGPEAPSVQPMKPEMPDRKHRKALRALKQRVASARLKAGCDELR